MNGREEKKKAGEDPAGGADPGQSAPPIAGKWSKIQDELRDTFQHHRKLYAELFEDGAEPFGGGVLIPGDSAEEIAEQLELMAKETLKQDAALLKALPWLPADGRGLIDKGLLREIAETLLAETIKEYKALQPFILEELKKEEYDGAALADIYAESVDIETGELKPESRFTQILEKAREARDGKAPHATPKRAEKIDFPLDKINSKAWNLLEKDTAGQIVFNMAPKGKTEALAYYAIDFSKLQDVTITKRLEPFDKRVYSAIAALYNAGNNVFTTTQVYHAMGGTTETPGLNEREKINDAITKMTNARIFVDNRNEIQTQKGYPHFRYDGSLLPLERGTAVINGKFSDAAIHIFREPPLVTFARQRKQLTTVSVKLLQSPMNKTNGNLLIDDYLIERISRAKLESKKTCRILKSTLYKNIGIEERPKTNTEKSAKQRAPGKVAKYLNHYKKQEFIKDFSEDPDGFTIMLEL